MITSICKRTVQEFEVCLNDGAKVIKDNFEIDLTYCPIKIPNEQRGGYHHDFIYRNALTDVNYVNDGTTPVKSYTTFKDTSFKGHRHKDGTHVCFHKSKKLDEIVFFPESELNETQLKIKKDIKKFCGNMKRYEMVWACDYFDFYIGSYVNKNVYGLVYDKTVKFISYDDFLKEIMKIRNNRKWL